MVEIINELDREVPKARLAFRAYDNVKRKALINWLLTKEGGVSVTTIYKSMDWEQSVASQHLKILRDANLVTCEKSGKVIYYQINPAGFDKLLYYSKLLNKSFRPMSTVAVHKRKQAQY